jgi:hypothetical protein
MRLELHHPFSISSRLLASLRLPDGGTISIETTGKQGEHGRPYYNYFIDLPDGQEFEGDDLQGFGGLQAMFESLLSFLGAAAESYAFRMRTGEQGENEDLFPAPVVEWAHQNSDELDCLRCEIEETEGLIVEKDDKSNCVVLSGKA